MGMGGNSIGGNRSEISGVPRRRNIPVGLRISRTIRRIATRAIAHRRVLV